ILLDRMEIKLQRDSVLNFSKTKPYSRKFFVSVIDTGLSTAADFGFSKVDVYNMRSALMNNSEWTSKRFPSRKPIFKTFYKTPSDLYGVHVKDFDLVINPVIQFVVSKEKDNDQNLFLNTRGLTFRGRIANKIGFAGYFTDNQERDPAYVQQWINQRKAVPGEGLYKEFKDP